MWLKGIQPGPLEQESLSMADENPEANAPEEEEKPVAAASGKTPLVIVLLLVNMVALGTVAFFQYKFMEMEANRPDLTKLLKQGDAVSPDLEDEAAPTDTVTKEKLVGLATLTVNLAQGAGPIRYVRLNAVLKMDDAS